MGEFRGNQHTENQYDEYGYDDLVEDVRSLAAETGATPTTRDAMEAEDLPCLARIYDVADDWQHVLADAGVGTTQVERYSAEERPEMARDLRRADNHSRGDSLTTREYDSRGEYPTSVLKDVFGSWSDACVAAGVKSGKRHGQQVFGPNGERLDSRLELGITQMLDDGDIQYVVHPRVESTNWIADFYLPAFDLWVEADGYVASERPNADSFAEKLAYYRDEGLNFEVVSSASELRSRLEE